MAFVKLARQSASQIDQLWEGQVDMEKDQVVIRHGRRGATLRTRVVPKSCFTEFNAELELEYRATKKREAGYVDEIESETSPQPAAQAADSPWPTLYAAPTQELKQNRPHFRQCERDVAQQVMRAFDLDIPAEWLERPRLIEPNNDFALPMLLYVLGVCRSRAIDLADDEGHEIQPVRFAEQYGLAGLDPRVPALLPEIGLVSAQQAMACAEPETVEESDWFF